jgi:hypothetical protein
MCTLKPANKWPLYVITHNTIHDINIVGSVPVILQAVFNACIHFHSSAYTAYSNAHFGEGEGPILLDDLICTGSESRLIDCSHEPIGQYDFCTHNDDAGLRCEERTCATS